MIKIILLAGILCLLMAQTFAPKTKEAATASFHAFDSNQDGLLSKKQAKNYFDQDYLKDFKGIDIDPKFLTSAMSYILGEDKNGDGLSLPQFLLAVIPKQNSTVKLQPDFYREQDL